MAAYSAVVSLGQLLKQLLDSDQFPPDCPKPKLESLHFNVSSLQSSIEMIFPAPKDKRDDASALETKIREAIYAAQDKIESSISKSLSSESEEIAGDQSSTSISLDGIIANIVGVVKVADDLADSIPKDQKSRNLSSANSDESTLNSKSAKIVGQQEDKKLLEAELTSADQKLQVLPISGMAGIGKTTLAKSIYDDEEIQKHFPIRAWVTVSQDYNVGEILAKLLSNMRRCNQLMDNMNLGNDDRDPSTQLRQNLYETRYLIVIDDMWDEKVWDRVRITLPDDRKGSRIILTTRLAEVAAYAKPEGFHHKMRTLNSEDSWELLCHLAFEGNPCPDDRLKAIGTRITKSCGGLPLSITVVGGLIYKSPDKNTKKYWESIAEDVNAAAKDKGAKSYQDILALSYIHLPGKLKGCFLYMGLFPEDSEIPVSKLIRLWVAEGFLSPPPPPQTPQEQAAENILKEPSPPQTTPEPPQTPREQAAENILEEPSPPQETLEQPSPPQTTPEQPSPPQTLEQGAENLLKKPSPPQTLEEMAKGFLKNLIDRNLVYERNLGSDRQIKTCGMHDTLRDLAAQKSRGEKFFHSIRKYVEKLEEGAMSQRRISVHKNVLMCLEKIYESTKSIKNTRSLLYVGPHHHHQLPFSMTFKLLRVFDALTVYFMEFPHDVIKLIHLRYLSLTYNAKLPSSLSRLQKLQILIVRRQPKTIIVGSPFLPEEIWNMPELRHLLSTGSDLPSPSGAKIPGQNSVLLANLQSLSNVRATTCTKEVLKNMPNLKKLGMWLEEPCAVGFFLDELNKLDAFKFTVLNPIPRKMVDFQPGFVFPQTLRKLSLSGCGLPWEYIEVIRQLPHLEVLKLRELAFHGKEWIMEEEAEFPALKFLLLEYLNLKSWGADYSHFPKLEHLIIKHCYDLEDMDPEIGDIGGLQLIELVDCSPQAVDWAKEIKKKKKSYNYKDFQVRIYSSWE